MKEKILITGAAGLLGNEFVKFCQLNNKDYSGLTRQELDITNFEQVSLTVEKIKPDVIVNCAAYAQIDTVEDNPDLVFSINARAVEHLAKLCAAKGIVLIHFSTDQVFDGKKATAYTEEDQPNPLNVYAKSKLAGEQALQSYGKNFLLFRVSWLMGQGKNCFLNKLPGWIDQKNNRLRMVFDEISVPTSTEDVARIALMAYERGLKGLFHLTNSGYCRRYDLVKYFFEKTDSSVELISITAQEFNAKAKRPAFSAMTNSKIKEELGITIASWQEGVDRFIQKKYLLSRR